MNKLLIVLISIYSLIFTACSKTTFEGTYTAAGGMQEFYFKANGTVAQSLAGNKVAEYQFEKKGSEIKIYMNKNTSQIFTLQANGVLIGPGGIKLTPKV